MHTNRPVASLTAARLIYYTEMDSPIGPLLLTSDGTSLTGLYMSERRQDPHAAEPLGAWGIEASAGNDGKWVRDDGVAPFVETKAQLAAYFEGKRTMFDLPLCMEGTDFQRRVWALLTEIPFGTTISYGELARRAGNPSGSRAVGSANGQNPISIIVPCHRVIGSNGKLTGYGGGLPRKAALLDFEFAVRLSGPRTFPTLDDERRKMKDEG
jgi:methylated-DNA-[protein]-cysteine S-methyltransferase